jgi:hypothetical protein
MRIFSRMAKSPECRFPRPWTVEEQPACFVVRDHNGQALAYIYYESEPERRSAAKLLSKDDARRTPQTTVVGDNSFTVEQERARWQCSGRRDR